VPGRIEPKVTAGGRVLLAFGGVVMVVLSSLFFCCVGAFSLMNASLPIDVRCQMLLDWYVVRNWFLTLTCLVAVWGGMYMLVTAAVGRNLKLFNTGTAVVLMWIVLGVLFGWLLWQ
jgi:hypothetical protein